MSDDDIINVAFDLVKTSNTDVGPEIVDAKAIPMPRDEGGPPTKEDLFNDFSDARKNILDVIEESDKAAKEVADIAFQSQGHKDYEALAQQLKVKLEATRDLIDLHAKVQKLSDNMGGGDVQTIQNNLFLGSTADLQRLLKDMRDGKTDLS